MSRLVALTGATGFLGRRLLPALAAAGWRVRVLSRSEPQPWQVADQPEVIRGDLLDAVALGSLCAGADMVIHAAGLIKARGRCEFFRVNADGARAVAAAIEPQARMLLVSSLAAREPRLSSYAASKRAGEEAVRVALGGRLSVVRAPAVYGPGDRATLPMFKAAAAAPMLPMLGAPEARLALIHVDDAARQIAELASRSDPGVWALGGARPQGYSWREVLDTLGDAVGRHAPLVQVPSWLTRMAGGLSQTGAQFAGRSSVFTRGKAREMLHRDWSVSTAEMAPGLTPARFDLASGFGDTVAWYRAHGWIGAS